MIIISLIIHDNCKIRINGVNQPKFGPYIDMSTNENFSIEPSVVLIIYAI